MNVDDFLSRPIAEIAILVGLAVGSVCILLFAIAFVLDKLNVKTFSFTRGFTFYEDGDEKKSRVTGRRKVVSRRTRK